jgi:long-subunit acyl-CoA synthetase (AMP-forming)
MTPRARVCDLLDATAARHPDRPAMKAKRNGQWHAISWREYREQVHRVARGFIKLGLQPGDGVAIIGFNRLEWVLADIGAILAGGVPAGIYTTNSAEQCRHIIEHADCSIAVAENAEQLAKLKAVWPGLPKLKALVLMTGSDSNDGVVTWEKLLALGGEHREAELAARIAAQKPDDVCTLIYTSGTTGNPKAVMITHDNIRFVAENFCTLYKPGPDDAVISYLPLSHIAEQVFAIYNPILSGICVSFAESMEQLGDNLREVRPTLFVGVPRVWEKIQEKMVAAGVANPPLRQKIVAWAKKAGLEAGYADQDGRARPLLYPLANRLVFSKVRERLGFDRCRAAFTSAAPIAKSTLEYFLSLGIPICEIYGMSECTGPATVSLPDRYRTGKAGFCIPGAELKIAADGEIWMRGPHVFKGYYKGPGATAEMMDAEGWLKSGDIGTLDAEGFLQITDRKKNILITSGGENIAPQVIEGQLMGIPVVSQAVVIGDRRKYVVALLTLDPAKLAATAAEAGSDATDLAAAAACAKYHAWLQHRIDEVNLRLARVQTIKRFEIIPGELTVEGGELTPTMKIRRNAIIAKYEALIERMYAD